MKHLDLFSGIGGFALAARWMGWQTVQFVEIDSFCQKVLNKNFPNVPIHGDIKTFNGEQYRGTIDILTGGFPCQPFSKAGKREGSKDSRFLWPEMRRVIQEIEPSVVIAENVPGILRREDGLAFEQICVEMEDLNYQVWPTIIPASGVGSWHRRDRVWITCAKTYPLNTNTNGFGSHRKKVHKQRSVELRNEQICLPGPLVSKDVRYGTDPRVFRNINGLPDRVDRIKSLGNAIVPQVAFEIFKAIKLTYEAP